MRTILLFITTVRYIAAYSWVTEWNIVRCIKSEKTKYQTCLQLRFQGKFLFGPEFWVDFFTWGKLHCITYTAKYYQYFLPKFLLKRLFKNGTSIAIPLCIPVNLARFQQKLSILLCWTLTKALQCEILFLVDSQFQFWLLISLFYC